MIKTSLFSPNYLLLFVLIGAYVFVNAAASNGDRSFIFDKCLTRCLARQCSNITNFSLAQATHMKLLLWSCDDECKYYCMWYTVDAFKKDGSAVPQFYGKWPFIRFAGIQEPASMVFSLLNAAAHLMIFYYRSKVPPWAPMYKVVHGMAAIGTVAWLCAAVFHTRDTSISEKMDYFSAFALVLYGLFMMLCRLFGTEKKSITTVISLVMIVFYGYHVHYLSFVKFDYGYNMVVNVTLGVITGVGWVVWCFHNMNTKPYVWKCFCVILGLNALLLLEVGDFPPLFWTFDAHAIWHGGTVPFSLLWYRFLVDDALHEISKTALPEVKKMI